MKISSLFILLLFYSLIATASRYDSTITTIKFFTDGEDCSSYTEAERIAIIVKDHDSLILSIHYPDFESNQWDKIKWIKFYTDSDGNAFMKEDSISHTYLPDT